MQLRGLKVLYGNSTEFVHQGNEVEVRVEPYARHDILYRGGTTGFDAESIKAAELAGKYPG